MGTYICSYVSTRGPIGGNRRPYPLRIREVGCKTVKQLFTMGNRRFSTLSINNFTNKNQKNMKTVDIILHLNKVFSVIFTL